MESVICLLLIAGWSAKVSYHCFRYKNAYWVYPTISGFKSRKDPIDSKGVYRLFGFWTGLWAIFFSVITCIYVRQLFSMKW